MVWDGMGWYGMGWVGMDLSAIIFFDCDFSARFLFSAIFGGILGWWGGIDDGMGWGFGGIDTGNICEDRQTEWNIYAHIISSSGSFLWRE
jgi:hypothetical protein